MHVLALFMLCIPLFSYAGNTQVRLSPDSSTLGPLQSVWYTHTTTDVGNHHGLSVQVQPSIRTARNTQSLAEYFTQQEQPLLTIAPDRFGEQTETVVPFHAIQHNPISSPHEEEGQLILEPCVTIAGCTLSLFYDAFRFQPGFSATVHIPFYSISAGIEFFGGTPTMHSYFSGTFEQINPVQDKLRAGLFYTSHEYVVGPIQAEVHYNTIESADRYFGVTLGARIIPVQQRDNTALFSYASSRDTQHALVAGCDAGTTIWHTSQSKGEIILSARYRAMMSKTENRILGITHDDGSIPVHSIYLLGAEKNKSGTFPLANILNQPVLCHAHHEVEATIMTGITWKTITCSFGYGMQARGAERVTATHWPEERYAQTYPEYDTDNPFDNAVNTHSSDGVDLLANHRYITSDMLHTQVAGMPASVSVSGYASIGYHTTVRSQPVILGVGASYEHGCTAGTPSLLSGWFQIAVSL